ncbi:MAG: helix-turn-helix transcriptional regulator [Candidatus Cryptobacteroides sp.]
MELLIAALFTALLFSAVILWELPMSLAPVATCFSLPRRLILPLMLLASGAGLLLGTELGDLEQFTIDLSSASVPVAICSALAVVLVLHLIGQPSAILPSLTAALAGTQLYYGITDSDIMWIPLQWLASMVLALILGVIFSRFLQRVVLNSNVHLLLKLSRLGALMSVAAFVLLFAVGMNLSGLLSIAFAGNLSTAGILIGSAIALACFALLSPNVKLRVSSLREEFFDMDAATSLACVIASALSMLVFARGTIVSPSVVMLCALAGARNFRAGEITVSVLVAPFFSALSAFTLCALVSSVGYGRTPDVAEAVAGLFAIACCVLLALLVRALKSRPKKVDGGEDESYRRLNELKVHSMQVENEHLQNLLELRRRDAMSIAERISEQSEFIDELYSKVAEAEMSSDPARKDELLHEIKASLGLRRNSQDERTDFYNKVEALHQDFTARLSIKCPQLSAQERKLATLLRLEFSTKYIAALLGISPKSVEVERHRLRKKLGLTRSQNLIDYIKAL